MQPGWAWYVLRPSITLHCYRFNRDARTAPRVHNIIRCKILHVHITQSIANAVRALTCFKLNTRAPEPAADAKIEFFLSGNINYVNNKQWYNCGESDSVYDQIKKVNCVKYAGGCMLA